MVFFSKAEINEWKRNNSEKEDGFLRAHDIVEPTKMISSKIIPGAVVRSRSGKDVIKYSCLEVEREYNNRLVSGINRQMNAWLPQDDGPEPVGNPPNEGDSFNVRFDGVNLVATSSPPPSSSPSPPPSPLSSPIPPPQPQPHPQPQPQPQPPSPSSTRKFSASTSRRFSSININNNVTNPTAPFPPTSPTSPTIPTSPTHSPNPQSPRRLTLSGAMIAQISGKESFLIPTGTDKIPTTRRASLISKKKIYTAPTLPSNLKNAPAIKAMDTLLLSLTQDPEKKKLLMAKIDANQRAIAEVSERSERALMTNGYRHNGYIHY